ncbi:glycosyltransferase family 4 protein [Desulfoferula mesophila]
MWEEIRYLGQRHDLDLVCLSEPAEAEHADSIQKYCREVNLIVRSVFQPPPGENANLPVLVLHHCSRSLERALVRAAKNTYDAIMFEHIYTSQYQPLFDAGPSVLAEHNIESEIMGQAAVSPPDITGKPQKIVDWKLYAAKMHMAAYEDKVWPRFPLRLTVSREDKSVIDERCQRGKTVVIENGVSVESIPLIEQANSRDILFMGSMSYFPNVDAALYFSERILPLIHQADSRVRLIIAGRDPTPEIRRLHGAPGIQVVSNPPSMERVAEQCALTVVPLRLGGGTRLKILHAMAMGLPVVSTSLGCAGLQVAHGRHLLVEDQPEAFARAVLELLDDRPRREALRHGGRELVEQRYDWRIILAKLDDCLAG